MAKFSFSSKADTLLALGKYTDLNIPLSSAFTVKQWREAPKEILNTLIKTFYGVEKLAIRSSCLREDSSEMSGAGMYRSMLNVPLADQEALAAAIDAVIDSYGAAQTDDKVLCQAMISHPVVTGVIMTRSLNDGAPYYVLNYDDESGLTNTITGGRSISKTVFAHRGVRDSDFNSPRLRGFVALARRLEDLCASDSLDIEFCLDSDNTLRLLQVRPMCALRHWPRQSADMAKAIDFVADFVSKNTAPTPQLFGQSSILGVMPDWNPAEMIGILPRPLASSLYRNLITKRVWSKAREAMGYRKMPPTELMVLLLGRPYIDVRASFNSFLPAGLDPVTSEALVSAWLERLEDNPQLHDKVEFEVAQTVLDFCFDEQMDTRYPGLLTSPRRKHFRECLRSLTACSLDASPTSSMNRAFDAVTELRNQQTTRPLVSAEQAASLTHIGPLLEESRNCGTLPFSILARHAFIAESLLRSAVDREALDAGRLREFKLSVCTISGELSSEFMQVCSGERDALSFMRKYGHLRPGTYDILSPRYIDRTQLFGEGLSLAPPNSTERHFEPSKQEIKALRALLTESGLPGEPIGLFQYAAKAIAGRELAKFVFSRNLSDVLEILALWGQELGFDRDALSFIDIEAFLNWIPRALPKSPKAYFSQIIQANREIFVCSERIKLGYLIRSAGDVYIVPQHRSAPNYIGGKAVRGEVVRLGSDSPCDTDLGGKIVCIENADPGFDWIFTRGIAGLVTRFGGANSHMAIRCAEYNLSAAIGVGEQLFSLLSEASAALIDPQTSIVRRC